MDGCVRWLAISLMTDWVPELIDGRLVVMEGQR